MELRKSTDFHMIRYLHCMKRRRMMVSLFRRSHITSWSARAAVMSQLQAGLISGLTADICIMRTSRAALQQRKRQTEIQILCRAMKNLHLICWRSMLQVWRTEKQYTVENQAVSTDRPPPAKRPVPEALVRFNIQQQIQERPSIIRCQSRRALSME